MKKPNYGIDAPPVIRNLILGGFGALFFGFGVHHFLPPLHPLLASIFLAIVVTVSCSFLLPAIFMVYSSLIGKRKEAASLIAKLGLSGHERVLDAGCGRGVLLLEAAKKLKDGKAVGIDIWQNKDQSGNGAMSLLLNASLEKVEDRIEVVTADLRSLPFSDASFHVAVSSLAIHNISNKEERQRAIREIARVVQPGGKIALLDFQFTAEYQQVLQDLGWRDVAVSSPSYRMFPPVRTVMAVKPL